ncbi:hypothetical protein GCM10009560_18600 [Nonomuraea longicatena]|uniref:Uncharacterized protein n=1 Tax=Nonomuraea longicatena TaxID=83682 RepID=A0ABN1P173_9ACTN
MHPDARRTRGPFTGDLPHRTVTVVARAVPLTRFPTFRLDHGTPGDPLGTGLSGPTSGNIASLHIGFILRCPAPRAAALVQCLR